MKTTLKDGVHYFTDRAGQWRWQIARKGRITAIGESHKSRANARRAFVGVVKHIVSLVTKR